jgi:hypothetical protein
MAGKSRRVASRQAQLSRRRKKAQKGPGGILPSVSVPAEVDGQHTDVAPSVVPEPPRPATSSAPSRPSPVTPGAATPAAAPTRTVSRHRGERPPTYDYVGAEMRRILLMGSGVLAVIIALGVVL